MQWVRCAEPAHPHTSEDVLTCTIRHEPWLPATPAPLRRGMWVRQMWMVFTLCEPLVCWLMHSSLLLFFFFCKLIVSITWALSTFPCYWKVRCWFAVSLAVQFHIDLFFFWQAASSLYPGRLLVTSDNARKQLYKIATCDVKQHGVGSIGARRLLVYGTVRHLWDRASRPARIRWAWPANLASDRVDPSPTAYGMTQSGAKCATRARNAYLDIVNWVLRDAGRATTGT